MSILPSTLKSFKYYKNKLPLYLQNSHGFQEHFKLWYDAAVGYSYDNTSVGSDKFNGIIPVCDTFLSLLDIFDSEFRDGQFENAYLEKLKELENTWEDDATEEDKLQHPYGTKSDILDKLGSIYGVRRNLTVSYTYEDVKYTNESLSLDNEEFLLYIKLQIVKNYCNGSYEQLQEYYGSTGLDLLITTSMTEQATSYLYLISTENTPSLTNIQKLFYAGELRIPAMGIKYVESSIDVNNILIWNKQVDAQYFGWGTAEWL